MNEQRWRALRRLARLALRAGAQSFQRLVLAARWGSLPARGLLGAVAVVCLALGTGTPITVLLQGTVVLVIAMACVWRIITAPTRRNRHRF